MCTGGRAGVRYVVTKFSRMDSLPNFVTHGAPLRALRAHESSAIDLLTDLTIFVAKNKEQYVVLKKNVVDFLKEACCSLLV